MTTLWVSVATFAFAIVVNCASVWAQKRHRAYDRLGRCGWPAHIALLVVVWGVAIAFMVVVGVDTAWSLPAALQPLGIVLGAGAAILFAISIRELGWEALFNGNFFGRGREGIVDDGIYSRIPDPMYVSYTLSFVALALRTANAEYFVLAAVSLVGLNGFEAWVERIEEHRG